MTLTKQLKRADIGAANDLPYEDVEVPEWGGLVRVRAMTATERSQYQTAMVHYDPGDTDGEGRMRGRLDLVNSDVRLAALTMIDAETGARMYGLDEVDELGQRSAAALNRIVEVAQRLSAITKRDVEEMQARLKVSPNDDSSSSLPESSE